MALTENNTLLTEAATRVDFRFQKFFRNQNPKTFWQLFADEIPSFSEKNKYPVDGDLTGFREWLGERIYEDWARFAFELKNRTFEKSVKYNVDQLEDDAYAGDDLILDRIAYQGKMWPEDLVFEALLAGGSQLCFDGQFFFDTDHPVDPSGATSGTYANLFTTTALTNGNFSSVLASMQNLAGRDGRPRGFGQRVALVVPTQLRQVGQEILNAALVANGGTNVNQNQAELIVIPRLGIASATTWYVMDLGGPAKPLFFQKRMAPRVIAMTSPEDEHVFAHNEARIGAKARGAAGYGMPWTAAKCTA
jgi:phage major head subunit gpT-like protein